MLEDCGAGLLVTNAITASLGAGLARGGCAVLNVNEAGSDFSEENPSLPISPERPAWILYTSGSTGGPKGTVHTHRTVLHNILRYTNGLHLREEDRLTVLHSFCFGASTHNTFGALLNGASLFPYDIRKEGLYRMAAWLAGEELTIYHSVPMVFRQLVASLPDREAAFPRLRLIKLGGEPVSRRDASLYRKHFSENCLLHVGLGTTEMPNFRQFFLDKDTDFSGSVVPVGYAVPEVAVLVLDEAGESVGTNVLGQIAVKSRYLSPGYWRRPDLTREAFLANPNGGDERTYRTGDLGYLLPDDCLVHAGREDFQAKIRGHRVETAEVEAALLGIDGIWEAAVAARPDRDGGQRLVAYLVAGPTPAPPVPELQKTLRLRLPEALIPSAVVLLDSLPSTPNGKLDRRALPDPDEPRPDRAPSFVAPRSSIEAILASVWSEVLRLSRVGVHDDFFALGGHSLKATQVLLRLHQLLGVDLPLSLFFEKPTIAGLAAAIARWPADTAARDGIFRILAELQVLSDGDARRLFTEPASRGRAREGHSLNDGSAPPGRDL
jgi:acyl-coenzyme A synthetase/AMP-(fatty) acid ligase